MDGYLEVLKSWISCGYQIGLSYNPMKLDKSVPDSCGVYIIRCRVNEKVYVGRSISLMGRKYSHWFALANNEHVNQHLQNAWNLHGEDSFEFTVVQECCQKESFRLEVDLVQELRALDPAFGFNIKDPSSDFGYVPDPSCPPGTFIPPLQVGPSKSPERAPDPKVTAATRAKMSRTRKGVPKSEETRFKMEMASLRRRESCAFNSNHVKRVRLSYLNVLYWRPGGISLLAKHLDLSYAVVYDALKGYRWTEAGFGKKEDKRRVFEGPHIEVVCGPMFASKSTELILRLRQAKREGQSVVCFKHALDDRYSKEYVFTHANRKFPSYPVSNTSDILQLAGDAQVVGIDEAQFFDGSLVDVVRTLSDTRRVIVAGLDMDYRGEPFGPMPFLAGVAEQVDKVTAICSVCGGYATKTQRLERGGEIVQVGVALYEARCRIHWALPKEEG